MKSTRCISILRWNNIVAKRTITTHTKHICKTETICKKIKTKQKILIFFFPCLFVELIAGGTLPHFRRAKKNIPNGVYHAVFVKQNNNQT